jgi:hypothetical protein
MYKDAISSFGLKTGLQDFSWCMIPKPEKNTL